MSRETEHGVAAANATESVRGELRSLVPYYEDDAVTIYHGDAREILPGLLRRFDALVTDPPYGIGSHRVHRRNVPTFADEWETTRDVFRCIPPELSTVAFASHASLVRTHDLVTRRHERVRVGTWLKSNVNGAGGGGNPWLADVEFFVMGVREWPGRPWSGVVSSPRSTGNPEWQRSSPNAYLHPTQKPLGVMRHVLGAVAPSSVVDPFMGSGTTVLAAREMGIPAVGIEIEERYCEIAARRMGQEVLDLGDAA